MISCVMSIYGFYSTNLVLRRPETSATDKSHFCSFDAPSVYLSSFSVRRPIGFRPPPDQIPSAARSDCERRPIGLRTLYGDNGSRICAAEAGDLRYERGHRTQYDTKKGGHRPPFFYNFLKRLLHY